MARLIDADKLLAQFPECIGLREKVSKQPTLGCYCEECMYAESYNGTKVYLCNLHKDDGFVVGKWRTDFCSEGQKVEE